VSEDVLVVNVGSSSTKVQVVGADGRRRSSGALGAEPHSDELLALIHQLDGATEVGAVGHRVAHGGPNHTGAAVVTEDLLRDLDGVALLAPLHDPPAIAVIRRLRAALPDLPAVACFDTAFHATLPEEAYRYAVPREWLDEWGLRRYGFHGLSHRYAAHRAAELLGRPVEQLRIVTCHLGAGSSLCAVAGGRSIDTTMGFTPMEGLVMATRSGDVDPGALLWLERRAGLDPAELEDALWHRSGLAALSGTSGDMREVLTGAANGDPRCRTALDVHAHRLCAGIAAMAASLGGLDALVFTGGIGENAPTVRAEVARRLAFLGVALDADANDSPTPGGERTGGDGAVDAAISAAGAAVATLVVHAREDHEIAREVRSLLA